MREGRQIGSIRLTDAPIRANISSKIMTTNNLHWSDYSICHVRASLPCAAAAPPACDECASGSRLRSHPADVSTPLLKMLPKSRTTRIPRLTHLRRHNSYLYHRHNYSCRCRFYSPKDYLQPRS